MTGTREDRSVLLRVGVGVVLWLTLVVCLVLFVGHEATAAQQAHTLPTETTVPAPSPLVSASVQRDSIVITAAQRAGIPVALALAVSHVEDWSGDSTATSSSGALGIMQVMPGIWESRLAWACGHDDLRNRRYNACIGTHVLAFYLTAQGSVDGALRAYNGATHRHELGDRYVASVLQNLIYPRGSE